MFELNRHRPCSKSIRHMHTHLMILFIYLFVCSFVCLLFHNFFRLFILMNLHVYTVKELWRIPPGTYTYCHFIRFAIFCQQFKGWVSKVTWKVVQKWSWAQCLYCLFVTGNSHHIICNGHLQLFGVAKWKIMYIW